MVYLGSEEGNPVKTQKPNNNKIGTPIF
jgi:hypothetical protein